VSCVADSGRSSALFDRPRVDVVIEVDEHRPSSNSGTPWPKFVRRSEWRAGRRMQAGHSPASHTSRSRPFRRHEWSIPTGRTCMDS
ncbi:MAG TPA: hypothetical protein VHN80_00585, partial [Kineosporiaceae bacterium]|nr:hypothetical protein [Kineosporiaceae bacterium]